ncbi:MAG: hypothetical protein JWP87_2638 [Labilithrix sp.]|nr:hypothetical protein [Labilithrix sp.]
MRRHLFFSKWPLATFSVVIGALGACGAASAALVACGSTAADSRDPFTEEAGVRIDGGLVDPAEAGIYDGGAPPGPEPSCAKYCDLVMESCTDQHAQYASRKECLELCARLPEGHAGDNETNTVACRQYYAGSPARTNAGDYCLGAGPFGGGVCGDRCTAFCGLALGACSPEAGAPAPYGSYADCQASCQGYSYRDGGADGGGEPPDGPKSGDTLNCRLYYVRSAVHDGKGCVDIAPDSGACRN